MLFRSDALDEAFSYEDTVLVEEFVDGREFSVAVLDGKALPVIEIEPLEGFYDYKNKYKAGSTKETCPANIPEDIASQMQFWAEKCCQAAGVTTYARVDELLDKNNNIFCLEINTLPGMTDTSLIPQEAAAVGISYDDAGRSKTKLGNNDFRLQRRIRETRHAGGIHPADQ